MNPILKHSLAFLAFTFFQVFLLNDLTLGQLATPYVFLVFLLMLPTSLPQPALFLIAFFTGLTIDLFSTTVGIHAFSCLLMIAFRNVWLRFVTTSSYRSIDEIPLGSQSLLWYALFLFPLILIHHIAFHFLEAFGFHNFWGTTLKILGSSLYTFVLSFLVVIVFYKKK